MCGRYSQTQTLKTIRSFFCVSLLNPGHGSDGRDFSLGQGARRGGTAADVSIREDYEHRSNDGLVEKRAELNRDRPSYNISPSQLAPVIVNVDGTRVLDLYRWGLIPSWAKDMKIGNKMINARCETVGEKPSFRRLVNKRRCLVPADGFYEWKKSEDGESKIPMRIMMKSEVPFAFAGLWDEWRNAEGQPLRSYTILTTSANPLLKKVHDRMPVILRPEGIDPWLDPGVDLKEMKEVFEPYSEEEMGYYSVSTFVNSPRNDTPECWERVGE